MDIEPDRPELVVMRLAQLHFRHPIKNFARIEIAKNPALEFEQKRRMNRVSEIEQNVRPGQPIAQFALGTFRCNACAARSCSSACRILIKQTIAPGQSMRAELSLEIAMHAASADAVARRGQKFEPDRIQPQPAQTQHPLQRHGKIAAAFAIFRRKAASEENRHAGIIGGKSS